MFSKFLYWKLLLWRRASCIIKFTFVFSHRAFLLNTCTLVQIFIAPLNEFAYSSLHLIKFKFIYRHGAKFVLFTGILSHRVEKFSSSSSSLSFIRSFFPIILIYVLKNLLTFIKHLSTILCPLIFTMFSMMFFLSSIRPLFILIFRLRLLRIY